MTAEHREAFAKFVDEHVLPDDGPLDREHWGQVALRARLHGQQVRLEREQRAHDRKAAALALFLVSLFVVLFLIGTGGVALLGQVALRIVQFAIAGAAVVAIAGVLWWAHTGGRSK